MVECPGSYRSLLDRIAFIFRCHQILTQRLECNLVVAFSTEVAVASYIRHNRGYKSNTLSFVRWYEHEISTVGDAEGKPELYC